MKNKLYQYLLLLADNSMILGHRLSELCGHGPSLETDIALTNISLDFFGQVRNYFQYAAEIKEGNATADSIAFLRLEYEYRNVWLVEMPNTDFAYVIARQFLFDAYHLPLLEQLQKSKDETIAAIANKSIKECKYHVRFSSSWVKRLGDGTAESHQRMQAAMDDLIPFTAELFQETELEKEMKDLGIGADL
ncbi:MAG TPA: phenylacetate-CoA oxygenase subunit PaaI, partial [Saprospiraceae bacterium]|nr:phenylacetate-CoA oxygenase subunit PaaI [Saprospiraceae bacterium]